MTENIQTREHYIAWRAEWRIQYKALSATLRGLKNEIASLQKEGNYAGMEMAKKEWQRTNANRMMLDRTEAKVLSMHLRAERLSKSLGVLLAA